MTTRKKHADKIMIVGIDGMDPKLTMKYLEKGVMPNTKRILERGVASKDLFMLGGMPTCTPPMWTTMATGNWPNVHGITDFSRHSPEGDDMRLLLLVAGIRSANLTALLSHKAT